MELREQAALVVGGTSGIGYATAQRLRDEGCEVVVTGQDPDKGRLIGDGIGAAFCRAEVRDTEALEPGAPTWGPPATRSTLWAG